MNQQPSSPCHNARHTCLQMGHKKSWSKQYYFKYVNKPVHQEAFSHFSMVWQWCLLTQSLSWQKGRQHRKRSLTAAILLYTYICNKEWGHCSKGSVLSTAMDYIWSPTWHNELEVAFHTTCIHSMKGSWVQTSAGFPTILADTPVQWVKSILVIWGGLLMCSWVSISVLHCSLWPLQFGPLKLIHSLCPL